MKKYCFLPLACLLIMTSCKPMVIAQSNVKMLSDGDVCDLHTNQFSGLSAKTKVYISNEMHIRKLDCSEGHQKCSSFGLAKGTKDYANCRLEIEKELAATQRQNDMLDSLEEQETLNRLQRQQSLDNQITPSNNLNCTTTYMGNQSNTNCY